MWFQCLPSLKLLHASALFNYQMCIAMYTVPIPTLIFVMQCLNNCSLIILEMVIWKTITVYRTGFDCEHLLNAKCELL